jgi:hypothetical protein
MPEAHAQAAGLVVVVVMVVVVVVVVVLVLGLGLGGVTLGLGGVRSFSGTKPVGILAELSKVSSTHGGALLEQGLLGGITP